MELGTENYNKLYITDTNSALPYSSSKFNTEKERVIKNAVTNNLKQAMEVYGKKIGQDFKMPIFSNSDWENILHNTCLISFLQGLHLGTSIYNNYVIVPSTENKQFVDETNIYYIGTGGTGTNAADGCYHRLGCTHLKGDTIIRIQ